jgi:hypothetical protein
MWFDEFVEANEDLAYELFEQHYPQCVHKVKNWGYNLIDYPEVREQMFILWDSYTDIDVLIDSNAEYA